MRVSLVIKCIIVPFDWFSEVILKVFYLESDRNLATLILNVITYGCFLLNGSEKIHPQNPGKTNFECSYMDTVP